jgi:drug/metabolite transporter (DMT)-like permease
MKLSKENAGLLLGLVGVLMFSLTLPMTRLAVKEIDPIWLALARAEIAALLGALALLWFKVPFPPKALWPTIGWTIIGVIFGFPVFSSIAMRYTDASHGAVVTGLLPLTTAVVATMYSSEKPSKAFWFTAIAGSFIVIGYALWQSQGAVQIGDASMLVAVVLCAFGYALGGKLAQAIGGWQAISWALVCAAPIVAIPLAWLAFTKGGVLESAHISEVAISARSWWAFAYVSIFSQLIGFFFWYGGMALGGVARVSQIQLLQMFFTLAFAGLINQEIVGWQTWLVAVIVVGIVFTNKRTTIKRNLDSVSAPLESKEALTSKSPT